MAESNLAADGREARRSVGRRKGQIRTEHCGIRYTHAEWEAVMAQARASGRTPTQFVREASLGARPKRRPSEVNAALIRELGRSGTALTHLAATARTTGALPEAARVEAALDELLVVVRRFESSRAPLPKPT